MERKQRTSNKGQTRETSRGGKTGEGSRGRRERDGGRVEREAGKELGGEMEREKTVKGDLDMETLNEHRLLHDADSLVLE